MSRKTALLLAIVCLIVCSSVAVASDLGYKPGELIVRFATKPDGKQRTILERNNFLTSKEKGMVKDSSDFVPGLTLVRLPNNVTVQAAIDALKNDSFILYAQPNFIYKVCSTFPNDTRFNELWGMHNTGQTNGTPDADIDAPEAWGIITDSNIIVAVIDTGVDYTHPDLAANMWVNEAELNGDPNVDDDGNGYVDDVYGYDFCTMYGKQSDSDPMDDHGHGTHCSGTIGAVGNNDEGVAGVCWNVRIMALKFLAYDGYGKTWDAISSINYAVNMGAKVLNNSWGGPSQGPEEDQALKDTIEAANANGVLFIAAAGNNGYNNDDSDPLYPASYDCNNIISVMATNHTDQVAYYSNYGPTTVDIGAPGGETFYLEEGILSTIPGNGYAFYQGTSMAAPHVTGACALVWGMNPMLRSP